MRLALVALLCRAVIAALAAARVNVSELCLSSLMSQDDAWQRRRWLPKIAKFPAPKASAVWQIIAV